LHDVEAKEWVAVAVAERIVTFVGDRQAARWDRFGGPGPVLAWCFGHPWLVTVGVAVILAVLLGSVFGVPPFSPLVLVVVLVAPIQPVLRAQQRVYDRWRAGREGTTDPARAGADDGDGDGNDAAEGSGDDAAERSGDDADAAPDADTEPEGG
jgi:hypothetical protein